MINEKIQIVRIKIYKQIFKKIILIIYNLTSSFLKTSNDLNVL